MLATQTDQTAAEPATEPDVLHRLSFPGPLLPVWIIAAMAAGLALDSVVPGLRDVLDAVKIGQVSLSIALGPLIEVPVLVALVYVSLRLRRRWTGHTDDLTQARATHGE